MRGMNFNEIQKQISVLVSDDKSSVSDFLNIEKKLSGIKEFPDYIRCPRLAFLSNFTIQGLPETMRARGIFHNLLPEIYNSPYNQYIQEILNNKSELYRFEPDLVYLFIDLETLPNRRELTDLIDQFLVRSNLLAGKARAKLVVLDKKIKNIYKGNKQVLFFDFFAWLKKSNHEQNWYTKYKELGDMRLAPDAFPDLAEQLLSFAVAVSGATKKCVVTDLDNTLWRGILGEDGLKNIKPNRELQNYLLELFNKGIILAINSKNNEDETLEVIEKHNDIILKKDSFAAWQINWEDKAENMVSLAKDLNIGIDSIVFLDDDYFQQNLIREAFPQVAVIPFDNWDRGIEILKKFAGFSKFELTKEDIRKGQMYTEERKRKELQSSLKGLDDFLKELDLKVTVDEVNESTIPRASQLTQKTNQFNLTTKRYSEEDIKKFLREDWKIWTISATDRFGDYGIIGLAMIEPKADEWRIDNLLMSCRILGRGIEDKAVEFLINKCKENRVKHITAEYIPTSKNKQAENFLDGLEFKLEEEKDNHKKYVYEF